MIFRQLESFIAVLEKGSISGAAASLGISQPAVSKHVAKLEEELGVKLFKRGHKCSVLTPEGEIVYKYAKQIHKSLEDVAREVAESSDQFTGEVRISASSIPGDFVLPGILVQFSRLYPKVAVDVIISDSATALESIVSRKVDIAIIGQERHPAGFEIHPFYNDELVTIVKNTHPYSLKQSLTQDDLVDLGWVGRTSGSGTRKVLESSLGQGVYRNIPINLRFGHASAVVNAVEHGAEAGIVSKMAIRGHNDIVGIPFDPPLKRSFFLIHSAVSTSAMGVLLDFLLEGPR
ncbi:MAG: LysR family transcriptional regulator [Synergistales bacterium]|nr:LysR family transcriptional regulator [Synergistales bacterium]